MTDLGQEQHGQQEGGGFEEDPVLETAAAVEDVQGETRVRGAQEGGPCPRGAGHGSEFIHCCVPTHRGFEVFRVPTGGGEGASLGEVYRTQLQAEARAEVLNTPEEDRRRLDAAAATRGLTLSPFIPYPVYDQALRAFDEGNVDMFFFSADNMWAPHLLFVNLKALKARGLYESGLIYALTMPRTNLAHIPKSMLSFLVVMADWAALRAAGDPLPHPGPFTVYRGVAGRPGARRVRGLSWTLSLPVAAWFALRFPHLPDPAVYRVTVDEAHVLAYVNHRKEEELLLELPERARPTRCLMGEELTNAAEAAGALCLLRPHTGRTPL